MAEKHDLQKLIGMRTEPRWMEYNWRDVALYALAVGAKPDELCYTYEKHLKALPTYGTIPYWGTVNVRPYQWMPRPASMFADELIHPTISFLNMDHEIIIHRPIDPIKGSSCAMRPEIPSARTTPPHFSMKRAALAASPCRKVRL